MNVCVTWSKFIPRYFSVLIGCFAINKQSFCREKSALDLKKKKVETEAIAAAAEAGKSSRPRKPSGTQQLPGTDVSHFTPNYVIT